MSISEGAFRRLFLFSVIREFPRGCMGKLRLQKVVYYASKNCAVRPFEFVRWKHGQFSRDVETDIADLLKAGLIEEERRQGNAHCYRVADRSDVSFFHKAADCLVPDCREEVSRAVREHGLLKHGEVYRRAHLDPDLEQAAEGEVILSANIDSSKVAICLPSEDVEDLELALSPGLKEAMERLSEALSSTDWSNAKVMTWDDLRSCCTGSSKKT